MNIKQLYEKTREGYKAFIASIGIGDITNLQESLDNKVSKDGDTITGDLNINGNVECNQLISKTVIEKTTKSTRISPNEIYTSFTTPTGSSSTSITGNNITISNNSNFFGTTSTNITGNNITCPKYIKTNATSDDILLGDGSTTSKSDFLSVTKGGSISGNIGMIDANITFSGVDNGIMFGDGDVEIKTQYIKHYNEETGNDVTINGNYIKFSFDDDADENDIPYIAIANNSYINNNMTETISAFNNIGFGNKAISYANDTYNNRVLLASTDQIALGHFNKDDNDGSIIGMIINDEGAGVSTLAKSNYAIYKNDGIFIGNKDKNGDIDINHNTVRINNSNYIEVYTNDKHYNLDLDAAIKAGIFKEVK